ncbi:LPS export ABC transporter periplasmic protein LptC [bacterium]|nr:LPS export ABC transporter periplasmic protein LptC [bacterium]
MHITKKQSYLLSGLLVFTFFVCGIFFLNSQNQEIRNEDQGDAGESTSPLPVEIPAQKRPKGQERQSRPAHQEQQGSGEEVKVTEGDGGFALENFQRSESKDGKLLWEVFGTNARYYPDEKRVDVEQCVFTMRDKKDKVVTLRAGKAKLFLDGPELDSAQFSAEVILDYGEDLRILTPRATYAKSAGYVTSPAHVKIIGSWYIVEGDGLKAHLEEQRYEILKNVSSIIEPKKQRNKP